MKKRIIATNSAPAAIGPYSQAVVGTGEICFISGQLPITPSTGKIEGKTIGEQTKQCLKNIKEILAKDNMTLENVVKTNVYLNNIKEFGQMNQIYGQFFSSFHPARVAFQVAALPQDALVEIEAIAIK